MPAMFFNYTLKVTKGEYGFLADIISWSMSYTNVGKVRTKLCGPYTYLGFMLQFDCPCGFSGAET